MMYVWVVLSGDSQFGPLRLESVWATEDDAAAATAHLPEQYKGMVALGRWYRNKLWRWRPVTFHTGGIGRVGVRRMEVQGG